MKKQVVLQNVYDKLTDILNDCAVLGDDPIERIQDYLCDIDNFLAEEATYN